MKYSFKILLLNFQCIIKLLIFAGLGCSMLYSTQLFDGINTAKTFYFIMIGCLILIFLFGRVLWKKEGVNISLSMPDVLLMLYMLWAYIRFLTSDVDSIHNLYFREFSSCVLWFFCLRVLFSGFGGNENPIYRTDENENVPTPLQEAGQHSRIEKVRWIASHCRVRSGKERRGFAMTEGFIILLGYIQLVVCLLQYIGIMKTFSPIFPVSGMFDNTSELSIYLTCIMPVAVNTFLKVSDTTLIGKFVRAVCLFYVLCWLILALTLGSRTSLLAGLIAMIFFTGFQIGFFGYLKGKTNGVVHKMLILAALLLTVCGLVFMLTQYKKDSASGRLLIWKVAWSGIKEMPLQGQGFNAFQAKYGQYQAAYFQKYAENKREIMIADNINAAFNDFIEIVFNLGFIGLFLYAAFWLSLFKGMDIRIMSRSSINLVAVTIVIIFLVSSGFYFVERMLTIKTIVLFFAALAANSCRKIVNLHIQNILMVKSFAAILIVICCFVGYVTIKKVADYSHWKKADTFTQFGYIEESKTEYDLLYTKMQHNGLFLYRYAKVLYANEAYNKSIECMELAKDKIASSEFYGLLGDAYFKTENYSNAITCYQYAAHMVPNRFRPLYKLFKLYVELEKTEQALEIAQIIVNKPIKVNSNEIQEIIEECSSFIHNL